ncbi:hypothetical protein GCM10010495_80840 [Kitasatospora herbaricolor]|uniref:helix-turn-helix domain-containing protein n=1 Tax=Kitasatospora herbaricolor TaxID=68217 RepID=UPI00174AD346|nr:helix-turn-helix transcriptional regulator [Kitasatospora herbaricolor]MDQ0305505.1 transcriptional regulator with XRE-family HTH domain [Kitasatospora herbaricolor]GGV51034.1 hypothetical protein GCM10010495_80840 [Kitasatospora herbaricolor]
MTTEPAPNESLCRSCGTPFPRGTIGRPAVFCSPDCRISASRAAGAPVSPHPREVRRAVTDGQQVAAVGQDMIARLHALIDLACLPEPSSNTVALQAYRDLGSVYEALGAAVVEQSRERAASWAQVGTALFVSEDTARKRWPAQNVDKIFAAWRISVPRRPAAPPISARALRRAPRPRAAEPRRAPAQPGDAQRGGSAGPGQDSAGAHPQEQAQVPPPTNPGEAARLLTTALSQLQRAGGKTLRVLARDAGISPSYVTRLLAGERIPSWQVVRSLAAACDADASSLRGLWEAARGTPLQPRADARAQDAAATLHDIVSDLHLAAARPAPSVICKMAKGRLRTRDVTALLESGRVPDWSVVDQVVTVLHGQSAELQPLWNQAQCQAAATLQPAPTEHATAARPGSTVCSPPAGSFG